MRVLNKKQKQIIKKWVNESYEGAGRILTSDDMSIELQEELERINDHETIWQNIDRYINDLAMEKLVG